MAERSWMPMYWGDYVRDTLHLTTEQHGAYLLLICSYWVNGKPLPDDDRQLSQICRMSLKKWKTTCPPVMAFFRRLDGRLVHDRIEKELLRTSDRSAKARASALQRARTTTTTESESIQKGSRLDTNAPSGASNDTPDNPAKLIRDQMWADGIRIGQSHGLTKAQARGLVAKALQHANGEASLVLDVLHIAEQQPPEALAPWLIAAVKRRKNGNGHARQPSGRGSTVEALRLLQQADRDREEGFRHDAEDGGDP